MSNLTPQHTSRRDIIDSTSPSCHSNAYTFYIKTEDFISFLKRIFLFESRGPITHIIIYTMDLRFDFDLDLIISNLIRTSLNTSFENLEALLPWFDCIIHQDISGNILFIEINYTIDPYLTGGLEFRND